MFAAPVGTETLETPDSNLHSEKKNENPLEILKHKLEPAQYEDMVQIMKKMPQVKQQFKEQATLMAAQPFAKANVNINNSGDGLRFCFASNVDKDTALGENEIYTDTIKAILASVCGKEVPFEFAIIPQGKAEDDEYIDISRLVTIEIEQG